MDDNVFTQFSIIDGNFFCNSCHSDSVSAFVRIVFHPHGSYDVASATCRDCHFTETVELDQ
ncbi:hypothetical protein [Vibrio atlanticus]|uniref:hypothetical protein n=1 Tax=Vibrio atlanticus TaxID=693153 RepID=UPI003D10BD68